MLLVRIQNLFNISCDRNLCSPRDINKAHGKMIRVTLIGYNPVKHSKRYKSHGKKAVSGDGLKA